MPDGDHKGTVLLTGASSAIGVVYADRLARRGYDMILVAPNNEHLGTLASDLSDATGRAVEIVVADLTDVADLVRVETILRTDASITMLVSNMGEDVRGGLLMSQPTAISNMITLNVTAFTRLIYAAIPGFVAREKGTLVNITTIAAAVPDICNGLYCATKAFIAALTRSLRYEFAHRGIRVQLVLPGFGKLSAVGTMSDDRRSPTGADNMVDAALAGLDKGDFVTVAPLPDTEDWAEFEAACRALAHHSPRGQPTAVGSSKIDKQR